MIRFTGIAGGTPWCVRFDAAATGDLIIPPARRGDIGNPAGAQTNFRERGQLILLGLTGTIVTQAGGEGISIMERVGASTDVLEVLRYVYPAAGTYFINEPELWIPLRGHRYTARAGEPVNDAAKLTVIEVGSVTAIRLTAWGIWADQEDHLEVKAAPLQLRPNT